MKEINLPPFYVGQKVVCINEKNIWFSDISGTFCAGPLYNEICVVRGFDHEGFVLLKGYDGGEGFVCEEFAPITENFQSISLEKVLEEETKLISVN